jgi:arginase
VQAVVAEASSNDRLVTRIDIIGVPMDLGASRRGVDMGPSAVRYAKLHDRLSALGISEIVDHGNLHVPIRESLEASDKSKKYFDVISRVCDELAQMVERSIRDGGMPVVIGGDHSIAMGTLNGLHKAYGQSPGLIWVDAHSDINSPDSSPSGNVHGMPLWFALKNGYVKKETSVLIGLRDVDEIEKSMLRDSGVRAFSMSDVDKLGMKAVMEEALRIAGSGGRPIHVSFDMDAIDPSEAPGTGTPVRGGLTYREAHLALEMAFESGQSIL